VPGFVNRHPPIVNEDVDYLIDDNAMDDICLSPELDGTLGMPTFEHSYERQNFREGQFRENRTTVNASWETKCKCPRKHQDTTKKNFLLRVVAP
jgi:hypothetical protein